MSKKQAAPPADAPGEPDASQEGLLARAVVYAFLSRVFAYPSSERLAELRARFAPAVAEVDGLPGEGAFSALVGDLERPLDELQAAHRAAFTLTASSDCPDFETAYSSQDVFQQTAVMADVAGFYRAHGLEVGGPDRDRPDSVVAELEFMAVVALKEARALAAGDEENAAICRESGALFLRDHLACWVEGFARRVELSTQEWPLYPDAARLLAAWLRQECESLAIAPAQLFEEPMLPVPVPDDGACPTGDEAVDGDS
ncbi:MAG: molecular chaperone TorD family protein [Dehalococcoidia bacterium]|nr:molecular chaperone TorD family protein [Dehalococcoidia bacterium]